MTAGSRRTFGDRLKTAMATHGPLCVGVDPHAELLSIWGLADNPQGLADFSQRCLEAFAGQVAAVKPQSAFFERFGSAGIAVLEQLIQDFRSAGTLVILDAKRGDIGSTMTAYAQAYLRPAAPLGADALTVSPFLGYAALRPAVELALEHGRGIFVLALTSNPEGAAIQHARTTTGTVAADIVSAVTRDNAAAPELGAIGLVIGATVGSAVAHLGLDLLAAKAPILAPGIGAQGAGAAELAAVFGPARGQVLASVSRAVLQAGPDPLALRATAQALSFQLTAPAPERAGPP